MIDGRKIFVRARVPPALAFALFIVFLKWSFFFTAPFLRPHEANNALYSQAARNHLRFGPIATRFSNSLAVQGDHPGPMNAYLNHPGTLSLLVAASFGVFGESEYAARIVPAVFSALFLFLLHGAARRRFGEKTAGFAVLFAALTPMLGWYGKMVNFEPLVLPLLLLLIDRFDSDASKIPLFFLAFAAALVDHPAVLVLPALVIGFGFRKSLIPATAGMVAALILNFSLAAWAGGGEGLRGIFTAAAGRSTAGIGSANLIQELFLGSYLPLFTLLGGFTALMGLAALERRLTPGNRFLAALLAFGLLNIACFPNAARIHEYWLYYLLPSVALLAGILLARVPKPLTIIGLLIILFESSLTQHYRFHGDTGWYTPEMAAVRIAAGFPEGEVVVLKKAPRSRHWEFYADRSFTVRR